MIITLMRKIHLADSLLRKNIWKKPELYGNSLKNKTIGIIGLGNIGSYVAEIAKVFNMKVLATVNNLTPMRVKLFKEKNIKLMDIDKLLKESDIISLHIPLKPETKYLIDIDRIKKMKSSSYLINTSRGAIINELDIIFALENKLIAGYATDVFEKERTKSKLFDLDNTVLTPHIGAMTHEVQKDIGDILVDKINRFVNNDLAN